MNSTAQLEPATFHFPDPPKRSIDKGAQLTHPKRHFSKGFTRLQPRTAGFSYNCESDQCNILGEILEPRRLNRQICEELLKGPLGATQNGNLRSEHRKHSLMKVFSSRSKRESAREDKKLPVATQRTSDGRNSQEHWSGEAKRRLSPYQTDGHPDSAFESLGKLHLTDRAINERSAAGRNDADQPESSAEARPMQSPPRRSNADDSLGLLRDLSQILSQGETTFPTAGASQTPVPEAEKQPRVRDFAGNGSASISCAQAAIRRRSRSPVKKPSEQTEAPDKRKRSLTAAATFEGQEANPIGWGSDSVIIPSITSKEPAIPSLAQPSPLHQNQVLGTKISPSINRQSKAPSIVSAESAAEDVQSDTSSGVVANAQSAIFVKVPPQPGPAPLTPLPSLPEGLDSFVPATPRARQSSQKTASPESSPPKIPPQKSPARSQYKLYPSTDNSPSKRPGSPIRMNAATEPKQIVFRQSTPLRSKRRGISFPRSHHLPTSMSVGTLDELEQWNSERAENNKQQKLRDLACMRSRKAIAEEVETKTRNAVDGKDYHEDDVELPSPRYYCNSARFPLGRRSQPSQLNDWNATRMQHKLSPIIVIAEQEPISPVQRAPSHKSQLSRNSLDGHPLCFKPTSPAPQRQEGESKVRPVSSHSMPVPRPVTSRVPSPHVSPLLGGSSRCPLHYCSMHELSGLEARLSAMERKNAMLERAFLAVLDTTAAFGGNLRPQGVESANGHSCKELFGKNVNRFRRTRGTESLYAGLENLLASARWSTSSGP
ncbi:hypothetical protein BDR22DRAFT_818302 [Usnea florida]